MSSQATASSAPLGVGIIGAGPVTQAIHLPTLARLGDLLGVRHIMDVDPAVASSVAGRVGATASSSTEELLADAAVDVVAICSPHQFHAEQVIAACRAGKKAVLCEKPFAMSADEASRILAVSQETGVPVIVGAMHTFDPGWLAAQANWGDLPQTVHTIRSSIVLPPNTRFEDFATEIITRPAEGTPNFNDPEVVKAMLQGGIMGLAIHDLPLVRQFTPDFSDLEILDAGIVQPFGYVISLRTPTRNIELRAATNGTWKPEWRLEAISDHSALTIEFTPSYVQAGSAVATFTHGRRTSVHGPFDHNGYEGEWRELAGLATGTSQSHSALDLIDDLTFALDISAAVGTSVDAAKGASQQGANA